MSSEDRSIKVTMAASDELLLPHRVADPQVWRGRSVSQMHVVWRSRPTK